MRWHKLGQFYQPIQLGVWGLTHAANPFPELLGDGLIKIYFNCRDAQQRSSIGYIVADLADNFRVLHHSAKPVLGPGQIGYFDDSGVSVGCMVNLPNLGKCLYFVGWNLSVTVPWRNSIGLAVWDEASQAFERYSPAPIIDRNWADPFSLSYPAVLPKSGGYEMWYGSNLEWGPTTNDMIHAIKYATSADGINWNRDGHVAIPVHLPNLSAYSRPCVIHENSIYKMWYSYRGQHYQIGYAESPDGLNWKKMDHLVGIGTSTTGWDSEMIEYAWVFDHLGKRYMIYNGNGYGKTGIGAAIWD
jgi:predicted GH43/DUF377 family glycosyl hydrolase